MAYSYLELVQKVLNRLDDESVAALDENDEATQVQELVNEVRKEAADFYPWAFLHDRGTLDTGSGAAHTLQIPTTAVQINWIRYDGEPLRFLPTYEFEKLLDGRDKTLSNVDISGCYTDRDPTYWTSYDDDYIYFDSYDTALDNTKAVISFVTSVSDLSNAGDPTGFPARFDSVLLDGITAAAFRVLKHEAAMADRYERKYLMGLARLKRRAERINQGYSTHGGDFARKHGANLVYTRKVVEG